MRTTAYPGTVIDRRSSPTTAPRSPAVTKTIPFDYVFEFKLKGKAANNVQDVVKLQDVVEISMQGVFVGVSLGYSFVLDERSNPRTFGPVIEPSTTPQVPVVIPFFQNIIGRGIVLAGVQLIGTPGSEVSIIDVDNNTLASATIGSNGTAVVNTPIAANVSFSAWDKTNNLVSQPITFNGGASTPIIGPDAGSNKLPAVGDKTVTVYGFNTNDVRISILDASGKVTPIDPPVAVLATFSLSGGDVGRQIVPLKVGGVDRPLAPGDTLLVNLEPAVPGLTSRFAISSIRPSILTLRSIMDGLTGIGVGQTSGFRFSQRFSAIFAANTPLDQIDPAIIASAFEPACGAEEVSFLYTIDVVSTGRELQNKPIHNIAGLGIANGDRPFRPFARPIAFEPRSVIRIQIEELSTLPGTLYIVLQGYKTLGTGRVPE